MRNHISVVGVPNPFHKKSNMDKLPNPCTGESLVQCLKCDKGFSTKSDLSEHSKKNRQGNIPMFKV